MEMVSKTFDTGIKQAASSLGVSVGMLKSFCRVNGIGRWPFRKIRRIERTQENIKVKFIKLNCDFVCTKFLSV